MSEMPGVISMTANDIRQLLVAGVLGLGLSAGALASAESAQPEAAAAEPTAPYSRGSERAAGWQERMEAARAEQEARLEALRERRARMWPGGPGVPAAPQAPEPPAYGERPPMPMDPMGRALMQQMERGRPDFAAGDSRDLDAEIERRRQAMTAWRRGAHPWSQARRDWQDARRGYMLQRLRGPGYGSGPWGPGPVR
jgi:hypothetical protein